MTFSPWDMLLLTDSNQYSNFQSFLDTVTPVIPCKPLSRVRVPILNGVPQPLGQEIVESFSLSNLWNFYTERSYYSAGVPILLSNGDGIVQYYCPSLSALQIYTQNPPVALRSMGKSCGAKHDGISWSDESENDELSMSLSNNSSKSSDVTSEDSATDLDALCKVTNPFGDLYCQFNETVSPYQRVPFSEKINELAQEYPSLLKFQSTDLSPYSWIAVAWYPIYQIPLTKNVKALSACFVTYHALSAFKGDVITASKREDNQKSALKTSNEDQVFNKRSETAIAPFAATTYKMNGELWTNPKTSDEEKIALYLNAATWWVKMLDFHHHDFNFFMSRRSFR